MLWACSGLKVNFAKSKIEGLGLNMIFLEKYSRIVNYSITIIPFTYLGIPVEGNRWNNSFWQRMILKIKNRFARWKGSKLSIVGKVCLIKLVLNALSLFFVLWFKMSNIAVKEITRLQRPFCGGGVEKGGRQHG